MRKIAAVSITMGKFVAGIVIVILAASAISFGVSTMLIAGPQGPPGEPGIGFEPTGYISIPASAFVSSHITDNN